MVAEPTTRPVILEGSMVLNRPIDIVFGYVSDLENYPSWFPGIVEMRALDADGSRYAEIARLPGGRQEAIEVERVAFDPPRHFAIHASLAPVLPRFDYGFEELGEDRTRFTWTCSRRGKGVRAALMQPVMALVLKPRLKRAFEALTRIFEHETQERANEP